MLLTRKNKLKKELALVKAESENNSKSLRRVLDVVKKIDVPAPLIAEITKVQPEVRVETIREIQTIQKEIDPEALQEVVDDINLLKRRGGGSMNRQEFIGGVNALSKYTDINWKAGTGITLTYANNETTKKVDITITNSVGGAGIVRSIISISADTNAGAVVGTDYVYLVSGTTQLTLPTAVGNNNLYTVKNVGVGTVTVTTTANQTIDGSPTASLVVQYTALELSSDGTNWNVT